MIVAGIVTVSVLKKALAMPRAVTRKQHAIVVRQVNSGGEVAVTKTRCRRPDVPVAAAPDVVSVGFQHEGLAIAHVGGLAGLEGVDLARDETPRT
jgi:hypothetical protein